MGLLRDILTRTAIRNPRIRSGGVPFWRLLFVVSALGLTALIAFSCLTNHASEGGELAVIFLGYTNTAPNTATADAVLMLKNVSKESIQMLRGVTIECLPAGRPTRWQEIDVTDFWLAPDEKRILCFLAPTNVSAWRVEASFIGKSQVERKIYFAKQARHWPWLQKCMGRNLVLIPERAQSRWVDPTAGGFTK